VGTLIATPTRQRPTQEGDVPVPDSSRTGFEKAEEIDALAADGEARPHEEEVRELVGVADFLTPELHRNTGADDAAEAVSEWAEGDPELLVEAEEVARTERHDESAELLHRAADEASGDEPS
jgi:hypothetical protein